MIRILYMSDLHLEMDRFRFAIPGWARFRTRHSAFPAQPRSGPLLHDLPAVDLIVLAGDIHGGVRGIEYAEQVAKFLQAPAIYVAGNHEFYQHDIAHLVPALRRAAARTHGRVHFLENTVASFSFSGHRLNVLGCTLWTDYALHGDVAAAMAAAARRLNDHAMIHGAEGRLAPAEVLALHRDSRHWLHATLAHLRQTQPHAKNLVVTHHAPSPSFLGARTGAIGPAYASNMLAEFAPYVPTAWIHGHTHFRHESIEETIRLASAPRGYLLYDGMAAQTYRPGVLEI
jgi:predicted phosphohydrolase